VIIDNESQLNQIRNKDLLVYPIPEDDRLHPDHAKILAYAIYDLEDKQPYIISVSHPEGLYHIQNLDSFTGMLYCAHIHLIQSNGQRRDNMVDYDLAHYLHTNTIYELPTEQTAQHYARAYPKCHKTNTLVSLLKLQERVMNLPRQQQLFAIPNGYDYYNVKLKQSFLKIQANGLHIDKELFTQTFGDTFGLVGERCYTQYNYYTVTGRPSNRFGGINYAALTKDDDTRECFVSRFGEDGILLELDFNAYHPHIIASLIGYDFMGESVYEHFAKLYHNTDNPTADQIEKAKEDTFRQLYGGIRRDYLSIPFFGATEELSKALWNQMQTEGYVKSPISGRMLLKTNYKDLTIHTLFNYFIQMTETELNASVLFKLFEYIQYNSLQSVPVLYTYDSILFDVHVSEFEQVINSMLPDCIDTAKFPIKTKKGINYAKLSFCKN